MKYLTVFLLFFSNSIIASTLTVFADINMYYDDTATSSGNDQVALNLLDGGTNVFMSTQYNPATSFTADGMFSVYDAAAGVTANRTDAELTAGMLAGVNLLVLDINFNYVSPYDTSEQSVIKNFLDGGGNVALIGEATTTQTAISYNQLLLSLGSSISYNGSFLCCGNYHSADTILDTPITAGVSDFTLGASNTLSGGTAAIQDQGFTVVAYEVSPTTAVPIPAAVWLFGSALAGLGWFKRKAA